MPDAIHNCGKCPEGLYIEHDGQRIVVAIRNLPKLTAVCGGPSARRSTGRVRRFEISRWLS